MSQQPGSPFEAYTQAFAAMIPEAGTCAEVATLGGWSATPEVILESCHRAIQLTKQFDELTLVRTLSPGNFQKTPQHLRDIEDDPVIQAARYCLEANGIQIVPGQTAPRKNVTITVDPAHNLAINGDKPQSISRRTVKGMDPKVSEGEGKGLRIEVLKVLAAHPEQAYNRKALWAAMRPGEEFDRNLWEVHIQPFLLAPPAYHGQPLVHAIKVNKQRYEYVFGNFKASFRSAEQHFKVEDEPIFTFDDGREVTGRAGRILHMLAQADLDDPVMNDDVLELYTTEELARLSTPPHKTLQLNVSGLNNYYFRGKDTEWEIHRVKTDTKDTETGFRQSGYYMERRLSVLEARRLVHFLAMHGELLRSKGIAPPSVELQEHLQRAWSQRRGRISGRIPA